LVLAIPARGQARGGASCARLVRSACAELDGFGDVLRFPVLNHHSVARQARRSALARRVKIQRVAPALPVEADASAFG
jgi:hypothetical protein